MFKGTAMSGLGKAFVEAEEKTGVNGIYLASLGCLESAFGTSGFAKERNNLFGYQAYDYNLNATKYFETKEAGVLFVAERIKANYLTVGGAYYNGITMGSISKLYATDPNHSYKIFKIMQNLVKKGVE
jgi:beta-N-acetylglucosaminidase